MASRSSPSTLPRSFSGNPTTPASGTATARAVAAEAATAMVRWPAPTRSAARPANCTAPGVWAAPPTTRMRPRSYLELPGSGSGQSCNRAGVTSSSRSSIDLSAVFRNRRARSLDVRHFVVPQQPPLIVASLELGQGHILDRVSGSDFEDLPLVQALADVAEQQYQRVVTHQHGTAAVGGVIEVTEETTDPQRDIGPRLTAWRAMVELAQPAAALGLQGEAVRDPDGGQQIEHAQLPVTQPLVDSYRQRKPCSIEGHLGGLDRPDVR